MSSLALLSYWVNLHMATLIGNLILLKESLEGIISGRVGKA